MIIQGARTFNICDLSSREAEGLCIDFMVAPDPLVIYNMSISIRDAGRTNKDAQ